MTNENTYYVVNIKVFNILFIYSLFNNFEYLKFLYTDLKIFNLYKFRPNYFTTLYNFCSFIFLIAQYKLLLIT